jgi:hypothetical protein
MPSGLYTADDDHQDWRHPRVSREWVTLDPNIPLQDEFSRAVDGELADGELVFARIDERVVWYTIPLNQRAINWTTNLDMEKFLGEPIRAAFAAVGARGERDRVEARRRFLEAVNTTRRNRVTHLRREGTRIRNNISEWERYIQENMINRRDNENELHALENDDVDNTSQYEAHWNAFLNHPRVERIAVEGNNMAIFTDGINITDPRDNRSTYLGKFKMLIPFGAAGQILYKNIDNTKQGRHHPHVEENGVPCLGEIATLVAELRSNGELSALLEISFQYLESYNPEDSWARYATRWFDTQNLITPAENIYNAAPYDAIDNYYNPSQPNT